MKHFKQRRGLTLVELMVVIPIILIIIALSFALLQRVMWAMEDAKVSREIKLLDQACEQFKTTFNHHPPGRIMLCEDMRGYRAAINDHLCQMHFQHDITHQRALAFLAYKSMEYLQAIFPGIDLNVGHDWNGDGVIDDRQYYLTGDEALVYFLGGMRYGLGAVDSKGSNRSAPLGFNTDKTNPTKRTSSTRLGPFFEFDESRVVYPVCIPNRVIPYFLANVAAGTGEEYSQEQFWNAGCSSGLIGRADEQFIGFFARYHDVWGTPYLYFRARTGQTNNYTYLYSPHCYQMDFNTTYYVNYHCWFADNYYLPHLHTTQSGGGRPGNFVKTGKRMNMSDGTASSKWTDIVPYIISYENGQVTYYNANRFQIISAGRDRLYGSGGYYNKESSQAELSKFTNYRYMPVENIPTLKEFAANHDNITNINFSRVVPRP